MREVDSIGSTTIGVDFARDAVLDLGHLPSRIRLGVEHDQLHAEIFGGLLAPRDTRLEVGDLQAEVTKQMVRSYAVAVPDAARAPAAATAEAVFISLFNMLLSLRNGTERRRYWTTHRKSTLRPRGRLAGRAGGGGDSGSTVTRPARGSTVTRSPLAIASVMSRSKRSMKGRSAKAAPWAMIGSRG